MRIYNVGPDALNEIENDEVRKNHDYFWIVYSYESGYYDGSGEAIALRKDGKLCTVSLGHCSCYGPLDSGLVFDSEMTVEEFLRPKDSIHDYDCRKAIGEKVRALLKHRKVLQQ